MDYECADGVKADAKINVNTKTSGMTVIDFYAWVTET